MKVEVKGNMVFFTSAIKFADIEKAKKYRPEALTMKDEDGKPIFRVTTGKCPEVGDFGIVFDAQTGDGFATACVAKLPHSGATKEEVGDLYGQYALKLVEFEKTFDDIIKSIDEERTAVLEQIELG